ncbi:MAG TPA: hypothetical protein VLF91_04010 [Candidatus Saccharimonadales bacterium]|nr:hypothetical protein [Candidatus Saccharimonadales bacterium]
MYFAPAFLSTMLGIGTLLAGAYSFLEYRKSQVVFLCLGAGLMLLGNGVDLANYAYHVRNYRAITSPTQAMPLPDGFLTAFIPITLVACGLGFWFAHQAGYWLQAWLWYGPAAISQLACAFELETVLYRSSAWATMAELLTVATIGAAAIGPVVQCAKRHHLTAAAA